MIGKSFAEYQCTYDSIIDNMFGKNDTLHAEIIRMLTEVAQADASGECNFNLQLVKNHIRFYDSRRGGYIPSANYTTENFVQDMLLLSAQAENSGSPVNSLRALLEVAKAYQIYEKDYERAFHYYLEIAAQLDTISSDYFPLRPVIYNEIATLYYTFKEYDDAIFYFTKVAEDPLSSQNHHYPLFQALNGLGLCYRYGYGDYDRSDRYFKQILEQISSDDLWWRTWEGIAQGNIGTNYYLRGDLDTALEWLLLALDKVTRLNDVSYRSQCASRIAEIYIQKQRPANAKGYIDRALEYHEMSRMPKKRSHLYEMMFHYYSAIGDRYHAVAYHDSTLMAKNHENEAFSGLVLRRIEQALRAADSMIYEQKMEAEVARSNFLMNTAIIVSLSLAIVSALLSIVVFLYRRKRSAYKELVRKSQQWAQVDTLPLAADLTTNPDNEVLSGQESDYATDVQDIAIMEQLEELMNVQKIYRNSNVTLDTLTAQLGFSRHYISRAVNRCARKNLSAYLNDYRIKEAIRIMSDKECAHLSVDGIAMDSGFNDRKSFHRIFKQYTGLTPSAFKNNLGK